MTTTGTMTSAQLAAAAASYSAAWMASYSGGSASAARSAANAARAAVSGGNYSSTQIARIGNLAAQTAVEAEGGSWVYAAEGDNRSLWELIKDAFTEEETTAGDVLERLKNNFLEGLETVKELTVDALWQALTSLWTFIWDEIREIRKLLEGIGAEAVAALSAVLDSLIDTLWDKLADALSPE